MERVERNVLPVLNNLLENREAQLEDGRFLMAPGRWDHLVNSSSAEEMEKAGLIRVDEFFRVIALGLPVPLFRGAPLDPPLRSRFQARQVEHSPYYDMRAACMAATSNEKLVDELLSVGYALNTEEARDLGVGVFPADMAPRVAPLIGPITTPYSMFHRLFPFDSGMLGESGVKSVNGIISRMDMQKETEINRDLSIAEVKMKNDKKVEIEFSGPASGFFSRSDNATKLEFETTGTAGTLENDNFYAAGGRSAQLASIMMSISAGDVAIIGHRGVGKQTIAREVARLLGQKTEPVLLYQDMSARDLLQQRGTDADGDTVWRYAPLVTAALEGRIAIVDGLDRLFPGTLALLHRLTQDREITLHDGTRLVDENRYNATREALELSEGEMDARGIKRIHPAFRIIALAEPPTTKHQWLMPEIVPGFIWHQLEPFPQNEESMLLNKMLGIDTQVAQQMTRLAHNLRSSPDAALRYSNLCLIV